MSYMDVMYGGLGQATNFNQQNLNQNAAMNQQNQAAIQQQQAAAAQQQAMLNNLYGPQGFGGQTAQYAGAGAAYGRGTGYYGDTSGLPPGLAPRPGGPTPAPANTPQEQAYFAAYPDVAQSGMTAAEHYMKYGQPEGRSAFGLDTMLGAFPSGGTTPYNDYGIPNLGAGMQPNFGAPTWMGAAAPQPDFAQMWKSTAGQFPAPNVPSWQLPQTQQPVDWDKFFNETTSQARGSGTGWEGEYLSANPDVAAAGRAAGADPNQFAAQHWKDYGQAEGRKFFDPVQYLQQNQDVAASGMDALQHYNKFGRQEGRSATMSNVFDPATYLGFNPDVAAAGMDPMQHWLKYGQNEGRQGGGIAIMNAGGDPSYIGAGQPGNSYNPFGLINSGSVGQQDGFGGIPQGATFDQRFGNIPGQPNGPGYFDQTFGAANSQPQAYNPTYGGSYPGPMASDNMANQQQMIADLYKTLGIIDNSGESGRYQNQPYTPSGNTLRGTDYSPNWFQ